MGRRESSTGRRESSMGRRESSMGRRESSMGRKDTPTGRRETLRRGSVISYDENSEISYDDEDIASDAEREDYNR